MYLVELRPGKEELYRTGDDLALAIRHGEVDARSRIYHRSTAKWISITLHPQYKAIVAGQHDELARPARKGWGLFPPRLVGQANDPSSPDEATETEDILQHWKQPLWLGLSSLLLVLGLQLAFSGSRPPRADRNESAVVRSAEPEKTEGTEREEWLPPAEILSPIESHGLELVSLASMTGTRPASSAAAPGTVAAPVAARAPILPRAPRLRAKALRAALAPGRTTSRAVKAHSVDEILSRYDAASDSARARLEAGMRVVRLTRLFASPRLTPGGGITDTRRSLAGAGNFIRVFRQQQAAIDGAYQDSVTVLAKRHRWTPSEVRRWYSRPQRKETPTLELLSSTLVAAIDSVLGVLDTQAGAYKIRGTAIAFEDPTAAKEYGVLRLRIKEQITSVIAAGGATSPGPASLLLQAIGTSTLPRET
jgi:hypothetical protein